MPWRCGEFMPEKIRTLILGYGLAGEVFHAPLLASLPQYEVCGIATKDGAKIERAKRCFPQCRIFSDADHAFAHAGMFDLVVIATPNRLHAPLAAQSLQNDLHVVIDKPVATTVAEVENLIAARNKSGKIVSVFQNRRWDGDFLTVKKLIEQKQLGDIIRIESRFERFRPLAKSSWREKGSIEEGAGLIYDLGSHLIDQVLQLFGKPHSIFAYGDKRRKDVLADDESWLVLSFKNGVRAHLSVSACAAIQGPRFRLNGLNGSYVKYGLDPQENCLREGRGPGSSGWGKEAPEKWGELVYLRKNELVNTVVETESGCYEQYYELMAAAILNNAAPPVTLEEALSGMQVIEAAHKAIREEQVQYL